MPSRHFLETGDKTTVRLSGYHSTLSREKLRDEDWIELGNACVDQGLDAIFMVLIPIFLHVVNLVTCTLAEEPSSRIEKRISTKNT